MRLIGHLPDRTRADRFSDLLYSRDIESRVDPGKNRDLEIWVLDDHRIDEAAALLERFSQAPDDPSFAESAHEGARRRARDAKEAVPKRARVVEARTMFYQTPVGQGFLTLALIGISVLVTVLMQTANGSQIVQLLSIAPPGSLSGLADIRHGQIWRLFTPMFLHFGIIHILFNMLWLRDLGSMIEARRGTWTLLAMVLVIAAASNLGQYWASGPNFGGMSGVVYGLLGYVWMQGRYNPSGGLALHPQTVTMMIIWFFLCLFHIIPNVANAAHGVGLAVGIAWGFIAAKLATRR